MAEPFDNMGTDENDTHAIVIVVRGVRYSVPDGIDLQEYADTVAFCLDNGRPIRGMQ